MTVDVMQDRAKHYALEWLQEPGNLRIAEYQRPYCWPESFITNFVRTILGAFDEASSNFGPADLGLIVLETYQENGNKIESIADGQQRLMTFALLAVAVLGEKEFKEKPDFPGSRIGNLLGASTLRPGSVPSENKYFFTDLETLLHAEEAYGTIKKVLDRELLQQKDKDSVCKTLEENLRQVTFGLLELPVNSENAKADRCIERLFEAFNTTAKPLNGGQILKARHYGAIAIAQQLTELEKYWQNQSEYFTDALAGLTTSPFTNKPISNDEFVDSPNQDAWYWPGYGFVQAVQGILLRQDSWWFALNLQGGERMDPFDRMEGIQPAHPNCPNVNRNIDSVLQNYTWKADAPLSFEKGWGFFAMTGRLKRLYADLVRGLESARSQTNQHDDKTALSLPERNLVTQALFFGVFDAIRTIRFVQAHINVEKKRNPTREDFLPYKLRLINAIAREQTNTKTDIAEVDKMLDAMTSVNYWLGIQANGHMAENSSGCMTTVVFSILLCWADRFEKCGWDSYKDDGQAQSNGSLLNDPNSSVGTLRQLALWLFLAARFDPRCRYSTILTRLHIDDAIAAAHFSHDLDNAWWRFMRQVRRDEKVKNFFIGLREFFSEEGNIVPSKELDSLIAAFLD